MTQKPFGHAAVLGSGMAGLVTARVLADFFERVTLIEKDPVPAAPDFRPGCPQGRHFHALLPGGLQIITELMPGIQEDLKAAGSLLPAPSQFYFYRPEGKSYSLGQYMPEPFPDDGSRFFFVQTRGLLEHCVRKRVEAVGNVETRYDTKVANVTTRDRKVTGVELDGGETLAADLVVDALGRGSKTPHWLEALGFATPDEDVINCDFAYTSLIMKPRDPSLFEDVGFFVFPKVGGEHPRRGGALVRMEHGQWLASVGGSHGDYPPRDLEGFMAYAKTLAEPRHHELISQAEAITEPAHYRFKQAVRRRYERLDAFPEGLLPIGDAICHYNPLHGQGMSAASRQAMALRRELTAAAGNGKGLANLWRGFFPEAYQETRAPWLFAAIADFEDPKCTGDHPKKDESHTLAALAYIRKRVAEGDMESLFALSILSILMDRLDMLERAPWPERVATAT